MTQDLFDKTGIDRLKRMFMTQPFVLTNDIRSWCNHRSRISDLRDKGFDIRPIIIEVAPGKKAHGYKMVPKEGGAN